MNIAMEISMYPLANDYVPEIRRFIDNLAGQPGIKVTTNTMSTQVFGNIDLVMDALRDGLRRSWSSDGKAVFVIKLINSDLSP